jgi:hypothetical protein
MCRLIAVSLEIAQVTGIGKTAAFRSLEVSAVAACITGVKPALGQLR